MTHFFHFDEAIEHARASLLDYGVEVDPGRWQGVPTEGKPDLRTIEVIDVSLSCWTAPDLDVLRAEIKPNLPWADDHFTERVGGVPTNPGKEYKNWPWWKDQDELTMKEGKFTHTYQERFWPDWRVGIRYHMGNLDDVVAQLIDNPYTRQAYLPVFFPEDTGALHGGRTPCTLGYHFLCRNDWLHTYYFIRSCDFVRHFRDDLYLAARLQLWVLKELQERAPTFWSDNHIKPGRLNFICSSLHIHKGDLHLVEPKRQDVPGDN
jgi:hypothetical protein